MSLSAWIQLLTRLLGEHQSRVGSQQADLKRRRSERQRQAFRRFVADAAWLPMDERVTPRGRMSASLRRACAKLMQPEEGEPVAVLLGRRKKPAVVFSATHCRHGTGAEASLVLWNLREAPRLDRKDASRLLIKEAEALRIVQCADEGQAALLVELLRALVRRRNLDSA